VSQKLLSCRVHGTVTVCRGDVDIAFSCLFGHRLKSLLLIDSESAVAAANCKNPSSTKAYIGTGGSYFKWLCVLFASICAVYNEDRLLDHFGPE